MRGYTHKDQPHPTLRALLACALCVSASLLISACDDGDTTSNEAGTEAGTPAGAEAGMPAGTEAGTEAGMSAGAEGGMSGGTEGGVIAGVEVEPEPEPPFCPEEPLVIKSERGVVDPYPQYIGVDDRFESGVNILQINMTGAARAGTYSLEGNTPEDCDVCAYIALGCGQNGCREVFFANKGTAIVTEMGEGGDQLTGRLVEADFMVRNEDGSLSEPDRQICLQEHAFDVTLPALVGDEVPDFQLQNCETGELESVAAKGQGQNGIWYIATAGWCPACRQHLNSIHNNDLETLAAGGVTPMFVVTEDDSYEPATLEFCRAYGRRYADSSANFYLDANLETTSTNMSLYVGDDGSFGLPWNALLEGDTNTLLHADGANTNLGAVLNDLLNR